MSVGKGSIKRAVDATSKAAEAKEIKVEKQSETKATPKKATHKKVPAKATVKPDTKKAPAKATVKPDTKKATVKPDTKKSSIKKTEAAMPVSNSTSDIHYGVGSELPIFLM